MFWRVRWKIALGACGAPIYLHYPAGEDVWAIENIATTKSIGSGPCVGTDRTRFRGWPVPRGQGSQINMFIDNVAARRTYERAGFRVVDERRSAEFERACGVPGLWSLRRTLEY